MQTIFAKHVSLNSNLHTATPRARAENFNPPGGHENANSNRALVDALMNSKIYREYERAFGEMTGLPVALQPVETWQLPHHGKRQENPFCALMSQKSRTCANCLQMQEKLCEKAAGRSGDGGLPGRDCATPPCR